LLDFNKTMRNMRVFDTLICYFNTLTLCHPKFFSLKQVLIINYLITCYKKNYKKFWKIRKRFYLCITIKH
jgi:hypothetical protein